MSKLTEIGTKICRKWTKIRLQPIRVFCFHHVSEKYNPEMMWDCDWVNTDILKQTILELQNQGYIFISITEAHEKLKHDMFRSHRYAVLTADDGFKSLMNIVPWLIESQIPITLFVNPKYMIEEGIGENVKERLDAVHKSMTNAELYLSFADVEMLQSPLVTFAYHGYEHLDEWKIDESTFLNNLEKCGKVLRQYFPHVIPYYAHAYGHSKKKYDKILNEQGLTPVYVSGVVNYNNANYIEREILSNNEIT